MQSELKYDDFSAIEDFSFLAGDLLSTLAANDARLLEKHSSDEIEEIYNEMRGEYLKDITFRGFVMELSDYGEDILAKVQAYVDENVDIIVIDHHLIKIGDLTYKESGEEFTCFDLDDYLEARGYYQMIGVYENRLVYLKKDSKVGICISPSVEIPMSSINTDETTETTTE